jgi:hypothetical protein
MGVVISILTLTAKTYIYIPLITQIVYCISRVENERFEIKFSTRGIHDIFPTTTKKNAPTTTKKSQLSIIVICANLRIFHSGRKNKIKEIYTS